MVNAAGVLQVMFGSVGKNWRKWQEQGRWMRLYFPSSMSGRFKADLHCKSVLLMASISAVFLISQIVGVQSIKADPSNVELFHSGINSRKIPIDSYWSVPELL